MDEANDSISSEFDEAIKSQNETNLLQPGFLCLISLQQIIKVSANEFHEGIMLYNNEGVLTNYLPDMLDAFCNSIEELNALLAGYSDDEFKKFEQKEEEKLKDRNEKRKYYLNLQIELMKLMKRINIMPGENSYGIEIVGMTKEERKILKKSEAKE